ncbi:MAG: type II toxin-antitoxin system prevent-host-death family antitoxin [Deltaproteobacteria bacterium]|nr:type II toxin-antitoxin system prevent-host-death family antitoxin [Deltaproteobacteria bacterium]
MKTVTTHEAKTHLSRLLAEVEAGQDVVILRGSVPAARLTAVGKSGAHPLRPRVGTITSKPISEAKEAFAPLSDDELALWGLR